MVTFGFRKAKTKQCPRRVPVYLKSPLYIRLDAILRGFAKANHLFLYTHTRYAMSATILTDPREFIAYFCSFTTFSPFNTLTVFAAAFSLRSPREKEKLPRTRLNYFASMAEKIHKN